jgi:hypothetical protein
MRTYVYRGSRHKVQVTVNDTTTPTTYTIYQLPIISRLQWADGKRIYYGQDPAAARSAILSMSRTSTT